MPTFVPASQRLSLALQEALKMHVVFGLGHAVSAKPRPFSQSCPSRAFSLLSFVAFVRFCVDAALYTVARGMHDGQQWRWAEPRNVTIGKHQVFRL